MPIYEATAQQLTAIHPTSFAVLGIKERNDLQRLLAARIDALADGLLVLAEAFADWAGSARRTDLLCLDRESRLVAVELKRDEDGGHMALQALRYTAMVAAMTFDQAVATLARHRKQDDFGKEIATAVLWPRDRYGMDLRCVRLRPHRMEDGRLLLDIRTLIGPAFRTRWSRP